MLARLQQLNGIGVKHTYVMVPMDGVGPRPDPAWGGAFYISSGSDYNATYITDLLVSQPGIDAVEIMNEEDLFYNYGDGTWWHSTSDPQKVDNNASGLFYWGNYTRAVACATYNQTKGNPQTLSIIVIGPSMDGSWAYGDLPPLGNLSQCVDWGIAATETGWWTSNSGNGISEYTHAKYISRLFMEYHSKGFPRVCSYELVDEFGDNGMQSNFGLIRWNMSVKPAYTALQGLIGLMTDKSGMANS